MNYDPKWDGNEIKGTGISHVSLLIILAVQLVFGALFFAYYLQVEELQTRLESSELRLQHLENSLERKALSGAGIDDKKLAQINVPLPKVQLSELEPREVYAVRVGPDGREIKADGNFIPLRLARKLDRNIEQSFEHKPNPRVVELNRVAVEFLDCHRERLFVYCELKLTKLGQWGNKVVISKDKSFLRTRQEAVIRPASVSMGTFDSQQQHQIVANLERGPVRVQYRFFGVPQSSSSFEKTQLNIDGEKVIFENIDFK